MHLYVDYDFLAEKHKIINWKCLVCKFSKVASYKIHEHIL